MTTLLLVSTVLLFLALGVRHFECARKRRFAERMRLRLDRGVNKVMRALGRGTRSSFEYIHKDVLLKGLHILTYLALVVVRLVERKLDKGTSFLRSFRKHGAKQDTSEQLRTIQREEESS